MDYTKMHADSLAQRTKRRKHANTPAKPTWKQQLIAAAKAIRETPQDAVIRLYGQYQKTRNASYKLVLQTKTKIKTICDRHEWPYPGNIA